MTGGKNPRKCFWVQEYTVQLTDTIQLTEELGGCKVKDIASHEKSLLALKLACSLDFFLNDSTLKLINVEHRDQDVKCLEHH